MLYFSREKITGGSLDQFVPGRIMQGVVRIAAWRIAAS
jgi:hypothetical protein